MTSFKCNNSFTYALRVIIWDVTDRRGESVRESERRYQRPLADIISKEQLEEEEEEIKTGISGRGSFVVAYFQPTTSHRPVCILLGDS